MRPRDIRIPRSSSEQPTEIEEVDCPGCGKKTTYRRMAAGYANEFHMYRCSQCKYRFGIQKKME